MTLVLIAEDDPTVADVLTTYLRRAAYDVVAFADGRSAADYLLDPTAAKPGVAVLDVLLPGLHGLELARRVRCDRPDLPIVLLTALGEEEDRILGLETGADDYITKPFSPREVILRIGAILRRTQEGADPYEPVLRAGALRVDPRSRTAELVRSGVPVPLTLTVREMELLIFFLRHPGRAFGRQELMERVWGWSVGDQSTVTVHVRRIRQKIEDDPARPRLLQTVWGLGYRMRQDGDLHE